MNCKKHDLLMVAKYALPMVGTTRYFYSCSAPKEERSEGCSTIVEDSY